MAPSSPDIASLSLEQLQALSQDVEAQMKQLQQARRKEILSQIRELAAEIGETPESLFGGKTAKTRGTGSSRSGRGKLPPKYRHPEDDSVTWSGRGRQPKWIAAWLADGNDLSELAIN